MKLKKIGFSCAIIFLILIICASLVVRANNEVEINAKKDVVSSENFKGTREFILYADLSNLENYISGGRTSLEYIIRMFKSDWLNFEISTENYDLKIKINFDFESYEDYTSKISELLLYDPTIIYDDERYIEGFSTVELANFIKDKFQENEFYLSDTEDIEIFVSGDSKIIFKDETIYEAKDGRINKQEESLNITLKSLKIDTTCNESGYTRNIHLELFNESASNLKKIQKAFEENCKDLGLDYKKEDSNEATVSPFTITINAKNMRSLSEYMIKIFGVGAGVIEKEEFASGNNVKITVSEYLDVKSLLIEDGKYEYTFAPKNEFEKLALTEIYDENSGYSVENNIYKFTGKENTMKYSYQKNFEFDKISIVTNFSEMSKTGKITRTVSLRLRTVIANEIHDKIKQSLSGILINNTTLNIYDEGAYRYYDIVVTSNSINSINKSIASILDGSSNLNITSRIFPFLLSKIEDNNTIGQICNLVENYENVELKYIFKDGVKIEKTEIGEISNSGNTYTVSLDSNLEKIEVKYKEFDKLLFAKIILFIIIIIIVFFIIRFKIKKKIKSIKEKRAQKRAEKENKRSESKKDKLGKQDNKSKKIKDKSKKQDNKSKELKDKLEKQNSKSKELKDESEKQNSKSEKTKDELEKQDNESENLDKEKSKGDEK